YMSSINPPPINTGETATSALVPASRDPPPPISAAPEAPLPGPELAQPSAPTAAEASVVETKRSKPRASAHWAEL
ncbi:hypothetical protein CF328_g8237, partial [Tilletia controversa]